MGEHSVVSQEAYLCAATHDHAEIPFPLIVAPIVIEPECRVAARAFVGPGVRMRRGAVAGAGSVLLSDVASGTVVAGSPSEGRWDPRGQKKRRRMSAGIDGETAQPELGRRVILQPIASARAS
jgi:acetyltransferase-like isoleucine patch superfamily enzyme